MARHTKGIFTMFRIKLAALVGALLIGLMSVIPAFAGSSSVTDLRLAPGSTVCLTPQSANTSADVQGIANGDGADFVVYNGAISATKSIYSVYGSHGFHVTYTTTLPQNATIPGKFKLCATN